MPIFHQKPRLRWVTMHTKRGDKGDKQHEIDMPNKKVAQRNYIPLKLGWLGFTLGWLGFALGPRGYLDTNMLVSVTQNARVGCLDQREDPTKMGLRSGGI